MPPALPGRRCAVCVVGGACDGPRTDKRRVGTVTLPIWPVEPAVGEEGKRVGHGTSSLWRALLASRAARSGRRRAHPLHAVAWFCLVVCGPGAGSRLNIHAQIAPARARPASVNGMPEGRWLAHGTGFSIAQVRCRLCCGGFGAAEQERAHVLVAVRR